jgi:hypothetical protein
MIFKRFRRPALAAVTGVLIFAMFPAYPSAWPGNPRPDAHIQDIKRVRSFLFNHLNDFEYSLKPLRGKEAEAALQIANKAEKAQIGLDAAFYFLVLDDRMQCDTDRKDVRDYLKQVLYDNSWRLDYQNTQIESQLSLVTQPQTKRDGIQLRDDLRAIKQKLDEILANLN